jgi:iron(II)-dependent oxidoreductase
MQYPPAAPASTDELSTLIRNAHARSLELVDGLSGEQLMGPRLAIVNPLLWEIGHVAHFHEMFILRGLDGDDSFIAGSDALYDSIKVHHDTRWDLPLPDLDDTLAYAEQVRDALLERLDSGAANQDDGYFYRLTTFHEDMHNEAYTYTRQTLGFAEPRFAGAARPAESAGPFPGDTEVPGGTHVLGAEEGANFVFDNEKWGHPVEVAPFRIAKAPVTNAEFAGFVEDRGYARRDLWDDEGWAWRQSQAAEHPVYWQRDGGGWAVRRFDRTETLAPHQPVIHVCFHEVDAFCRWAGRRLPTEAEWEIAAAREPGADGAGLSERKRRFPWGDEAPGGSRANRANLEGLMLGCVDVGAHAAGDSAFGCRQMLGNVWEWTSSLFGPFPGFSPDPYKDYSAPWFAERRRVLKGGAWASRGRMVSNLYRNFFTPDRRDVFAGFRTCAL